MSKPVVLCIVQARMGSSRLPGKVLKQLGGISVLAQVLIRLQSCQTLDGVIVAITDQTGDAPLEQALKSLGVDYYRGSENDVLDRYYRAALARQANVIVRVTSDCPLIDPQVVDKVVRCFMAGQKEAPPLVFASNTLERTYPRGLDVEVFSFDALEIAAREASKDYEREHVTPFIWEQPERFPQIQITGDMDLSEYRWTLDTDEDWQFLSTVFQRLTRDGHVINTSDVLTLLDSDKNLRLMNAHIEQKRLEH